MRAGGAGEGRVPRVLTEAMEGLSARMDRVAGLLERLVRSHEALREETEELRMQLRLRSAGTSALERQMEALEARVGRLLEPEGAEAPGDDDAGEPAPEEEAPEEDRYTLLDAVQDGADALPRTLVFLDTAFDSARESPCEHPERVWAVLDLMANVARKREEVRLNTSLWEAFGQQNVDYRGSIAQGTSSKLRTQYQHVHPDDGRAIECVEHIALGSSYDPRYCLRIYFTSRVRAEERFVIAHVGRHFEVRSST